MTHARILVVEDDAAIRRGLVDALRFAGYEVVECADGTSGRAAAFGTELDLVLLDVVLPGSSGFEILSELRRSRPALPVILVTARGAEDDRVHGLLHGADDYVVKPFSARELLARVEAVLRRSPARPSIAGRVTLPGCTVHLDRSEITYDCGGTELLSEKEREILAYLAAHRGRVIAREELLQHIWGLNPRGIETRTVDMHVARLREKLAAHHTEAADAVVTVRGQGYMLSQIAAVDSP